MAFEGKKAKRARHLRHALNKFQKYRLPIGGRPLSQSDVCRAFAAVTARFDIECYFLVIIQASQACTLNSRDVYKYIFRAAIGSDKAEAF